MFIPNGKRAKAKRERRSKNRKRVAAALDGIMNCKSGLDHVLDQYDKIKGSAARIGLCHDIAVAIIDELAKRGQAAGWAWCRGASREVPTTLGSRAADGVSTWGTMTC